MLSVSIRTIENYRKTGKLQTIKLGYRSIRIDRHEIEKMIEVEKWERKAQSDWLDRNPAGIMSTTQTAAELSEIAYGRKIALSRNSASKAGLTSTTG